MTPAILPALAVLASASFADGFDLDDAVESPAPDRALLHERPEVQRVGEVQIHADASTFHSPKLRGAQSDLALELGIADGTQVRLQAPMVFPAGSERVATGWGVGLARGVQVDDLDLVLGGDVGGASDMSNFELRPSAGVGRTLGFVALGATAAASLRTTTHAVHAPAYDLAVSVIGVGLPIVPIAAARVVRDETIRPELALGVAWSMPFFTATTGVSYAPGRADPPRVMGTLSWGYDL